VQLCYGADVKASTAVGATTTFPSGGLHWCRVTVQERTRLVKKLPCDGNGGACFRATGGGAKLQRLSNARSSTVFAA